MNMDFRKYLAVTMLMLVMGSIGLIYWELTYDANVDEELSFYGAIEPVPDSENALNSLVGIYAPLDTENIREWGKQALTLHKEGPRIGSIQRQKTEEDPSLDSRIHIELRDETKHYVCWIPGRNSADDQKDCMDKAEIREVIRINQVVMRRYQEAFQYKSLYYELNDNFSLQSTIALTKLAVMDYWLRRNDLSPKEVNSIFEMMRFWEHVIEEGNHSSVGLAIALVNYALYSSLITHLSEIDPNILTQYYKAFGKFHERPVDSTNFERIAKHEFRMLNTEFCFIKHYGDRAVDCQPKQYASNFKPGRTIKILYEQRVKYEDCYGPRRRSFDADTNDWLFWAKVYFRPGNYRGRAVAFLLSNGQSKTCEIFKNLEHKVKTNEFRNFYLSLKQDGINSNQLDSLYKDSKDLFRIGDSDQYYVWDAENESLVYTNEFKMSYTLPY